MNVTPCSVQTFRWKQWAEIGLQVVSEVKEFASSTSSEDGGSDLERNIESHVLDYTLP